MVFGYATGFEARLDLSALNGNNGFRLDGLGAFDHSGYSVSGAGDINGDGVDDLIIGAPEVSVATGSFRAGQSYVVFGSKSGFPASPDLAALDGTNGFVLEGGAEYQAIGFSVSAAGDVNGDGIDDVIIGAIGAGPNGKPGAGRSYLVFGSNSGFAASLRLRDLDGSNGFAIDGISPSDYSGSSVSAAGDVNGDEIDDLTSCSGRAQSFPQLSSCPPSTAATASLSVDSRAMA